jgi:hypothetical protein
MVRKNMLPQNLRNTKGVILKALEDAISYNEDWLHAMKECNNPDDLEIIEQTRAYIAELRKLHKKKKGLIISC